MGEPSDLPQETIDDLPDEPWYVVFTQDEGGAVEYDTNHGDINLALAMVQKGLYQLTEDALDDDFPEDVDEDEEDDDDDVDPYS